MKLEELKVEHKSKENIMFVSQPYLPNRKVLKNGFKFSNFFLKRSELISPETTYYASTFIKSDYFTLRLTLTNTKSSSNKS
jgi:hypothetical protein